VKPKNSGSFSASREDFAEQNPQPPPKANSVSRSEIFYLFSMNTDFGEQNPQPFLKLTQFRGANNFSLSRGYREARLTLSLFPYASYAFGPICSIS
jgi:hypothetical protein